MIYGHYHSRHHESPATALRLLSESTQECYRSRGPLGVDWIRMSVNRKLRMKAECFLLLLDLVVVVNQLQPSVQLYGRGGGEIECRMHEECGRTRL